MFRWSKRRWNDFAPSYNRVAAVQQWEAPRIIVELARPYLDLSKPILDVGCGTGLVKAMLGLEGIIMDGIDFSEEMMKQAEHWEYRHLIKADVREPYVTNERYGSIISVGLFGERVRYSYLSNLIGCLEDSTIIAIAGFSLKKLPAYLNKQGFTVRENHEGLAYIEEEGGHKINYRFIVATR